MSIDTCEHIRDLLPAFAEEALSAADAESIRAHLAACDACRLEADRWAALDRLLTEHLATPEAASAAEVEALVERVRREKPVWRVAPGPVRFWRAWVPPAALAAAAVLLLLLGLYAPGVSMAAARDAALDEVAAVVSESRALPQAAPEEAVAFGLDLALLPKHAALEAARQWDEGQGLTQAVTRRVGLAPLVACLALLLAANFLLARNVRGAPRPLPGG